MPIKNSLKSNKKTTSSLTQVKKVYKKIEGLLKIQ